MKKIRIITDSAADMDSAENAHLTVLPITINFGVTAYQDGVTLSRHDFYAKLIEQDELPITSQITPYAFEDAIRTAKESGETVIIITMASKLSGTHNSAVLAASDFDDVYVVDSESVCVGQRILVEYALRLVEEGTSAAAIVEMLEVARKNIRVIALLDTLEYLRRGGRISKVTGFVGGILSIKPVVAIENGEVVLLGKARGSRNGNNLLNEQIKKTGGVDFSLPYSIAYTGINDDLLRKYVDDNQDLWRGNTDSLPIHIAGCAIGTHVGPGAIAVAFFGK